MTKTISSSDLRAHIKRVLNEVGYAHAQYIVEKFNEPIAAVVSLEDFRQLQAARESQACDSFQEIIKEVRSRDGQLSPDEMVDLVENVRAEFHERKRGWETRIDLSQEEIAAFCRKWEITELALFGSVLREDFRDDSDVDVLVTFAAKTSWDFTQLAEMRKELEGVLGREVDLVERRLVEQSKNYIRRKHILTHAEPVYVAR